MKNIFWIIALSAVTLSSAYAPVQRQEELSIDVCEPFSEVKLNLDMLVIGPMHFSQDYFYSAPANVYAEIPPVSGAGYYDYEWYLDGVFQQISSYNHEFTFYGCGSHYLADIQRMDGFCLRLLLCRALPLKERDRLKILRRSLLLHRMSVQNDPTDRRCSARCSCWC